MFGKQKYTYFVSFSLFNCGPKIYDCVLNLDRIVETTDDLDYLKTKVLKLLNWSGDNFKITDKCSLNRLTILNFTYLEKKQDESDPENDYYYYCVFSCIGDKEEGFYNLTIRADNYVESIDGLKALKKRGKEKLKEVYGIKGEIFLVSFQLISQAPVEDRDNYGEFNF